MRHMYYTLDENKNVVPIDRDGPEFMKAWSMDRRVAEDTVGDYWISTVFLPMDHGFSEEGPPVVFETMVFDEANKRQSGIGDLGEDVHMERCSTWDEAVKMHKRIVQMVKGGEIPQK